MNAKIYSEKVREIKNEVLNEIRRIIKGKTHDFKSPFFVHYIDKNAVDTLVCHSVGVWDSGMVTIHVSNKMSTERDKWDSIEGEDVLQFEPASLTRILGNLQKEIRSEKLNTLRELIKNAGGKINFDGKFKFDSIDNERKEIHNGTGLHNIWLNKNSKSVDIIIYQTGEMIEAYDSEIPTYELDRIIEYVRKQTEKTAEDRLALTDEQQIIVNRIKNEMEELKKTGAAIMLDQDYGTLFVVNAKEVELNCYGPDDTHNTKVDIAKLPSEGVIGEGYVCYTSEFIYINDKD